MILLAQTVNFQSKLKVVVNFFTKPRPDDGLELGQPPNGQAGMYGGGRDEDEEDDEDSSGSEDEEDEEDGSVSAVEG